jgi:hypothetical protein
MSDKASPSCAIAREFFTGEWNMVGEFQALGRVGRFAFSMTSSIQQTKN